MKKEPLNYEAIFYTYDGKEVERLEYYGESPALASDHARSLLFHPLNESHKMADVIHYRKKGAVKWKEWRKLLQIETKKANEEYWGDMS